MNALANLTNMYEFTPWGNTHLTGNIETACANWYKLSRVQHAAITTTDNGPGSQGYTTDYKENITGNISVFADKYNMGYIQFIGFATNITGNLKDLKNLKNLVQIYCPDSTITGSKTDLYNGGASITSFNIFHTLGIK